MTPNRAAFARKYDASPFDDRDPRDVRAEKARQVVTQAFVKCLDEIDAPDGEAVEDILGGLLVGVIGIAMCHGEPTDENHATIRSGTIQLIPWAVDMVRQMDGRAPLADGN